MAKLLGFGIGLLLLAALPTFTVQAHVIADQCDLCHDGKATPAHPRIREEAIDSLCRGCHVRVAPSHPVGVVGYDTTPPEFWLDSGGRLSCATCHDPHARTSDGIPWLLRGDSLAGFCASCHDPADVNALPHQGAVLVAHPQSFTTEPLPASLSLPADSSLETATLMAATMESTSSTLTATIDSISQSCLTCHDGTHAPIAPVCLPPWEGGCPGHRIGMDYEMTTAYSDEFVPLASLNPLISLYEGKVGCPSCHNMYNTAERGLVFSNSRSALCMGCHIK